MNHTPEPRPDRQNCGIPAAAAQNPAPGAPTGAPWAGQPAGYAGYGPGYPVGQMPPRYAAPPFTAPQKTERKYLYTGRDFIFALAALLCGYLFCRAFTFPYSPLGATLFLLLLTVGAVVFLFWEKKKAEKLSSTMGGKFAGIFFPICLTLLSLTPVLQSGVGMRFFGGLLYFALFFYYLGMCGGY